MSKDKKQKENLAEEYMNDIMKFIGSGSIYPENLKDAYCSGYLRGYIDSLMEDVEVLTAEIKNKKWFREDA